MAFKLAELFVQITTKDSKFQASLQKGEKRLLAFREKLSGISKIARNFLIGGGIALALFVREASAAEESLSKFNAVFKEQAKAADQFAETLSKSVGRSKIELKEFLATLQDTFVPLGFAREEARKMSQQVTKLAIDLASFNDKSEPDVIRDLQSALVGNTETVRKYGIIITQATLNQELLNQGIAGGVRAATEAEKAQARLGIILQSTTDAQGDAERTAGSFANQMKSLKADVKDLSVALGEAFIPILQEVISGAKTILPPLIDWIKENKNLVATVGTVTGGLTAFVFVLGPSITAVTNLSKAIRFLTTSWVAFKVALVAGNLTTLLSKPIVVATGKAKLFTTALRGTTLATKAWQFALAAGVGFAAFELGKTIAEFFKLDKVILSVGRSIGLLAKEVSDSELRRRFKENAPRAEDVPGTEAFDKKHGIKRTPRDIKRKVKKETEVERIERELAETERSQREFLQDKNDQQQAIIDKANEFKKLAAETKAFEDKNKRIEDQRKKKAAEEAKREEEEQIKDFVSREREARSKVAEEAQKAAAAAAKAAPRARFLGLEELSKTIQKQLIGAKEREEAKRLQEIATKAQKKAAADLETLTKAAVLFFEGDQRAVGLGG